MTTKDIRKRLHDYIDSASDRKVKAFYVLFEEEVEDMYASPLNDPAFLAEMDRRYENYKANPSSAISLEDLEKKTRQLRAKSKVGKK